MVSAGGEQNPSVGAVGLCQLFFHLLDRFVKLLIGSKVGLALLNLPLKLFQLAAEQLLNPVGKGYGLLVQHIGGHLQRGGQLLAHVLVNFVQQSGLKRFQLVDVVVFRIAGRKLTFDLVDAG